jgi:hypothetical protein
MSHQRKVFFIMRTILLLTLFAFAGMAAEKKATKIPKSDPPAGAVKVDDNFYRFTDAKGKKWVYRKTPFGWAKMEETPETAAPAPRQSEAEIRVLSDGEVVKFEKSSPFGASRWERKIDELSADEKTALARFREQRAARQ